MSKRNNAARQLQQETAVIEPIVADEIEALETNDDVEQVEQVQDEADNTDEPDEQVEEDVIIPPVIEEVAEFIIDPNATKEDLEDVGIDSTPHDHETEAPLEEPIHVDVKDEDLIVIEPPSGEVMAHATDAQGRKVLFMVDLSTIDPSMINIVDEEEATEEQHSPSTKEQVTSVTGIILGEKPKEGFGEELHEKSRLSAIEADAFNKVYGALPTKSAQIRAMYADGYSKSCIAKMVTNGLYQHVYNVLKQQPKRQPKVA